jgi:hypothetical protein
MPELTLSTSWKITCSSSDEAQALRRWLAARIDPERILTDSVRIAPDGVEEVQAVRHRLGDYFAAIRTVPDSRTDSPWFQLVFQRRPEAGRFWKDLMVNVLQEIETTPQKPSIRPDSKEAANGTAAPPATAARAT